MEQAPFYVGQKVVCLKSDKERNVVKGKTYTVAFCVKKTCKCGGVEWFWHVGILECPALLDESSCRSCGKKIKHKGLFYLCGAAKYFAPIQEQRERIKYVAVSETLREKAIEIAAFETN